MRSTSEATRFRKDLKRCRKRGCDISKLKNIVALLANDQPLPKSCRPHKLIGEYRTCWECHIAPDWLLIYELVDDANALILVRTGTHADLFR